MARPSSSMPATAATRLRGGRRRGPTAHGRPASGSPATCGPWALRHRLRIHHPLPRRPHERDGGRGRAHPHSHDARPRLAGLRLSLVRPSESSRTPPSCATATSSSAAASRAERLRPGRNDQIVLVKDAKSYPQFEVRNVAANGEVWTGAGTETRPQFPSLDAAAREDWPTENMCSLAIRLRYGAFDYFSGGDMPGILRPGYPGWQDVETPVARAVGPVDVAILEPPRQPRLHERLPRRHRCGRGPGSSPSGPPTIPATTCSTACIRRASTPARATCSPPTCSRRTGS